LYLTALDSRFSRTCLSRWRSPRTWVVQVLLQLGLLGDVAGNDQQARRRGQVPAVRLQGDPVAVGVADPDADGGALPLPPEQLALGVGEPLQIIGMEGLGVEGAAADAGVGRLPEDPLGRRAQRADGPLGVQDADDVRRGVDHRLEGRLPLPQGVVGLLALGDVHGVAEGVGQGAVVVVDKPGHAVQPVVAVPEQEAVLVLQLRRPLGDRLLEEVGEALPVVGVELAGPEAGRPQHLLLGVAEQPLDVAADVALAAAA
jgi:hypothetical protein